MCVALQVLMTSQEAARLTHAQMTAWGTGGLTPRELRAVQHALGLNKAAITGRPATQFRELLKARVRDLPPPGPGG